MKPLMPTVEKIIQAHGGMDKLRHIRVVNPPFLRLVIEYVGKGPRGYPAISVAHYQELNGDLMRDPEVVFEVRPDGWMPVTFQQDELGVCQQAVGEKTVCPLLVAEVKDFARMWDRNIAAQGFLDRCPSPTTDEA